MKSLFDVAVNFSSDDLYNNLDKLVFQAKRYKVDYMIAAGTSISASKRAIEIHLKYPKNIFPTAGIHPHAVGSVNDKDFENFVTFCHNHKNEIVAIGECGLDYDRMISPKDIQIKRFQQQIDLSIALNKPLYLHERAAVNDFISIMKKNHNTKNLVHCFTGNKETLFKYLDLGCYFSISGWLCDHKRGKDLQEAVKHIPLDRIMLETDSPYLTPKSLPKEKYQRINTPENTYEVCQFLSKILKIKPDIIAEQTTNNAMSFFNITV